MAHYTAVEHQAMALIKMFNFEMIVYDEAVEFGGPGTPQFDYPYTN